MIEGVLKRTPRGGFPVYIDGALLDPSRSLNYVNHSPDGFAWGYAGSGPSQLAFALMLRFAGERFARTHYQDFKMDVIAKLPENDGFKITIESVNEWIKQKREQSDAEN